LGEVTIVDLDDVCISNVNRQLHALDGELGKPKVEVMARRLRAINPDCTVHEAQAFFVASNAEQLLSARFDFVIDAIDNPPLKALLIAVCIKRQIKLITAGGAGGRRDPTKVEVADLSLSTHDPLLRAVRRELRRHHGFSRGDLPFGVECVFSREEPVYPDSDGGVCARRQPDPDLRLDCSSGFGTASFVTGTFGFVAASRVVTQLAAATDRDSADVSEPVLAQTKAPEGA
jgi:tRNA A37 threonylcarbamoyladenosine dehydratase